MWRDRIRDSDFNWVYFVVRSTGLLMSGRHRRVSLRTACDECRDGDGQPGPVRHALRCLDLSNGNYFIRHFL